jgi:hypothetical protein
MSAVPPSTPPTPPASSRTTPGAAPSRAVGETTGLARSRARRDQVLALTVGIVLLGVAMLIQPVLVSRRAALVDEPPASLRSLAINFPRLTLGGFRGLLATALWYQAENDKDNHKWMDLETKYDIIGAIEPYFVTIYIFHAWNQAYNLSAQWHEVDSKYKWVLDGLAYLYKGEQYNPDNPDLILEEGHMYFLKLGGSFERIFFRAHWRSDIARLHELSTVDQNDKTDPTEALKLVKSFVDRPEFHTTELPDPGGRNTLGYGISITDSQLFDLRQDGKASKDPVDFRYGLSPFYFGYVEFTRCLAAGVATTTGQQVIDGWPAMSLRLWCRDDLYYSQQTMNEMFNAPEGTTPEVLSDDTKLNAKISEIRDCYRNVAMVAPKAVASFEQDMLKYPTNRSIHPKHINETKGYEAIAKAEAKLFEALVQWQADGRKMTDAVKTRLKDALPEYDNAIAVTYKWVDTMYPFVNNTYVNPDRADFERYVSALKFRKAGIENMLNANGTDKPDMSFLEEEVVER